MTLESRPTEISGIERDPALQARVAKLMGGTMGLLAVKPVAAQVRFFDDNGPRGGRAMRCALMVRLPYRPTVRVERTAETARLAFDAGFAVLERMLERYRERDRDNKRHPKKYFVARRVVTEEPAPRPKRARRP
jgi:ribosome-associated translation inhibitor RaiA